jgi:hypothetical protein
VKASVGTNKASKWESRGGILEVSLERRLSIAPSREAYRWSGPQQMPQMNEVPYVSRVFLFRSVLIPWGFQSRAFCLTSSGRDDHAAERPVSIAIAAPLAIATAEETVAAPVLPRASALKASSASAVMDVQYLYDFGPYAYRPVYKYKGYTCWYPGFGAGNTPGTTTIGEREFMAAPFWRRHLLDAVNKPIVLPPALNRSSVRRPKGRPDCSVDLRVLLTPALQWRVFFDCEAPMEVAGACHPEWGILRPLRDFRRQYASS